MVLLGLLAALATIIGGLITAGKEVVSVISNIFQAVFSAIQSFVQAAPTPMKMLIFLVFILTIGNIFSNFFLGMRYVCDSNQVLYENDNTIETIGAAIRLNFIVNTIVDRDIYIQSNFQPVIRAASPTNIKCADTSPRLFFYSINILDYKLWLLLLVLIMGAPLVWAYYSKMGVLW
jgi:hypothetical protein